MKIICADIVTAFDAETVGTKVVNPEKFWGVVNAAVARHDFTRDRVPGQGFIQCPEAVPFISAGVGRRTNSPADYHPVLYRETVKLFLKRPNAAPAEGCAVVVYTREAYVADPEVKNDAVEMKQLEDSNCTHVLVAVLGFAGPQAPLGLERLVRNLAGGNKEAQVWTGDEIRAKARESVTYWDEWATVAD